ncbi:MAG: methylated-DNA--[protein]-cysteine S-methyltransferase [Sphingomonadales bacterium]|jgi:methylated-DNA-[protein]-cysteine S-methyltransferase
MFTLSRIASPLGDLLAVSHGDTLHALDFADFETRMQQLFARHHPGAALACGAAPAALAAAFAAYFGGRPTALDSLAVAAIGSDFQRRVWAALRAIPAGETSSYGQLAAAIGQPSASRAVGLANGANPIGIVVPCHRVIGAGGALTGYAGGVERKAWLLRHEGAIL